MNTAFWTAISGINVATTTLDFTAHNLANVNTNGFQHFRVRGAETVPYGAQPQIDRVDIPGMQYQDALGNLRETSNTDIAEEMVNLITGKAAFQINLTVIKTQDTLLGTLLDIRV